MMKLVRFYIVLIASLFIVTSLSCKSKQSGVASDVNTGSDNANAQLGTQPGGVSGAKTAGGKVFKGAVSDKPVQMTLKREGDQLSGTYSYLKIGSDLSLQGLIDKEGNFTLKESDNSGKQTGEFKGKWSDPANLPTATLDGTWSKPGSDQTLSFYATEQVVEFASGLRVVTKEINEADKNKKYTIDAKYPELTGAANPNAEKFNQEVRSLVTKEVQGFKKDAQEMSEEDMPDTETGSYLDLGYDLTLAKDELVSVAFGVSTYSRGAAHPNHYTVVFNYDLRSGTKLKLSDLFNPGSGYLQNISRYSIDDLKRQAGKDGYDEEWFETGAGAKEENYENWNISKKGLAITFDPYQVASYAEGPKNVVVPYASLKEVIKPDGALSSVMNKK